MVTYSNIGTFSFVYSLVSGIHAALNVNIDNPMIKQA